MGWDISYHPISEKQMNHWYFDVLDDPSLVKKLSAEHKIEEVYQDKYAQTIEAGLDVDEDDIFDETHGYYVAVVQGFFDTFFYTRGSALSFSEEGLLQTYFKSWDDIVPEEKLTHEVHHEIRDNYSSGVYIPADKVVELLDDYENDNDIKNELDNLFSHERIKVFLKALRYAKERNLGILEATEVMEPNPMDLNESGCYSNLYNCDTEGPLLFQEAVQKQI